MITLLLVSCIMQSEGSNAEPDGIEWHWSMGRSVWLLSDKSRLEDYLPGLLPDAVRALGSTNPSARRLAWHVIDSAPDEMRLRAVTVGLWHANVGTRAECVRWVAEHNPCEKCVGEEEYDCYWCRGRRLSPEACKVVDSLPLGVDSPEGLEMIP